MNKPEFLKHLNKPQVVNPLQGHEPWLDAHYQIEDSVMVHVNASVADGAATPLSSIAHCTLPFKDMLIPFECVSRDETTTKEKVYHFVARLQQSKNGNIQTAFFLRTGKVYNLLFMAMNTRDRVDFWRSTNKTIEELTVHCLRLGIMTKLYALVTHVTGYKAIPMDVVNNKHRRRLNAVKDQVKDMYIEYTVDLTKPIKRRQRSKPDHNWTQVSHVRNGYWRTSKLGTLHYVQGYRTKHKEPKGETENV